MAKKPETRFKDSVNGKLPITLYNQSTYTPYSSGTPDHYYEDSKHLWVEYKFLPKIPAQGVLISDLLSTLQLQWAIRALYNGQPWSCIVGTGTGRQARGAWFTSVTHRLTRDTPLLTKEELAAWICQRVDWQNRPSPIFDLLKKSLERSASRTKCRPTATGSRRKRASAEAS